MVNELGEVRYVRRLRGQSEVWNVVEAVLVGLVCAAFCFRIVALLSDAIQVRERPPPFCHIGGDCGGCRYRWGWW